MTSDLVAFCAVHCEDELSPSDLYQFEKLRSGILLRLCPKSYIKDKERYVETDGKLIELLERDYSQVRDSKDEIREVVTEICKNEWCRIKAEAGGSRHIERKIEKYDASQAKSDKKRKANKE
jgi:hypothetical protein